MSISVERIDELPALPQVAMEVNRLLQDPKATTQQVSRLLKTDQSLTAQILKLANSSYYSVPGSVTTVEKALVYLGFQTICQLVLGVSVFSVFSGIQAKEFSVTSFWKHALGVGVMSELLGTVVPVSDKKDLFTAGLLHDVGKLALLQVDAPTFIDLYQKAKEENAPMHVVEKQCMEYDHTQLGKRLSENWGFPKSIQFVIGEHHQSPEQVNSMVFCVQVADAFCIEQAIGDSGTPTPPFSWKNALEEQQVPEGKIEKLESSFYEDYEKAGVFLNVCQSA